MAFSIVGRALLRSSREVMERNVTIGGMNSLMNSFTEIDNRCIQQQRHHLSTTAIAMMATTADTTSTSASSTAAGNNTIISATRQYKKHAVAPKRAELDSDNESDSDDDYERRRKSSNTRSLRGDSDFWRRKMRTLHRILDINRDGVVSFDDFNLLAKRFTDLGHLTPALSSEFMAVMRDTWEEQFGEINPYNLVTAEQFLVDFHHRLNDKSQAKRIGRFLPYLFKAVDYDHSGHLDLDQYKLFFRCLGLTDDDAAISFAVIDKNGDGQVSLKEFVNLGRQFFYTEDESKISSLFWGPLIDH